MISCITTAGIGNPGSFEALVALAGRHGIGGVDAGGGALKKLVEARGLEGARAFLAENRVQIGSIGLAVDWRRDDARFRQGLSELIVHAEVAATLGCSRCCTYLLPSVEEEAARFTAKAVYRLRQCARILGMYGLRLGLEFVGPYHLRSRHPHLFIYNMAGLLELIAAIGEPNVGLLLDAYHWYTTGADQQELEDLAAEQIVHVHVNDAKPVALEEALDNDRLFPGEGVIDLTAFVAALRRKDYQGFVSLEVLSQDPLPGDPEVMAAKAADMFGRLLA